MNCCYLYSPEHDNIYKKYLLYSIETLIKYYDKNINNIYILFNNEVDENIYDEISNKLNELIKNTNIKLILKLVDLNITNCIKYPENNINNHRINRIGLLKFFIPYLVDVDDILYIDCDILFYDNVYDKLIDGFKENSLLKIYHDGHNSGLIYFNCKTWRKHKTLLQSIIDYYKTDYYKNSGTKLVDNNAFEWISRNKYDEICVKAYDSRINSSFEYSQVLKNELNIIHVWGEIYYKEELIEKIYNHIMNI